MAVMGADREPASRLLFFSDGPDSFRGARARGEMRWRKLPLKFVPGTRGAGREKSKADGDSQPKLSGSSQASLRAAHTASPAKCLPLPQIEPLGACSRARCA